MTTDHKPRLFADDAAVRRVGEGLLDRSLPREDWTHEAHLASCLWLQRERADIDLAARLPSIIAGYNEAVGGVNSDAAGYHETITQAYVRLVAGFLADADRGQALHVLVNDLLTSPIGHRDALMAHYSRERLFSVAARRGWIEPDLKPLPSHPAGADAVPALGRG
ncbi:hypothetical protein ACFOMD_02815 [Sphingoaurantiacus capsulatus]|uniref:Uncharacterized protein n=1 Tax=Sphingoaurantiacus capsulatus TaxID=1771310 RepID=A0ABV7X7S5_9SPHN